MNPDLKYCRGCRGMKILNAEKRCHLCQTRKNRNMFVKGADWMSTREIAEEMEVTVSTVQTWAKAGKLPKPVKRGFHVRWPTTQINEWMQAR